MIVINLSWVNHTMTFVCWCVGEFIQIAFRWVQNVVIGNYVIGSQTVW